MTELTTDYSGINTAVLHRLRYGKRQNSFMETDLSSLMMNRQNQFLSFQSPRLIRQNESSENLSTGDMDHKKQTIKECFYLKKPKPIRKAQSEVSEHELEDMVKSLSIIQTDLEPRLYRKRTFDENYSPNPSANLVKNLDKIQYLPSDFRPEIKIQVEPEQYLLNTPIKCEKLVHSIDPKKQKNLKQLLKSKPIEIQIEVKQQNRKFFKFQLEYQLYGTLQKSSKISYICIKSQQKYQRYDARDISGFLFGGISSRFWYTKQAINIQKDLDDKMLCWNMVTLRLNTYYDKNLNLIITNEQEMNVFLQFLIEKQHEQQEKENIRAIKNQNNNKEMIMKFKQKYKKMVKPDFAKALRVYKNLRIFMKISYTAWKKGITVKELIMKQIMRSYQELTANKKCKLINMDEYLSDKFSLHNIYYQNSQTKPQITYPPKKDIALIFTQLSENPYCINQVRFARVTLLTCLRSLGIDFTSDFEHLQLLIEKERLIKQLFIQTFEYQNVNYYRIPKDLTQEKLSLAFQFYNCVIPLLHSMNQSIENQPTRPFKFVDKNYLPVSEKDVSLLRNQAIGGKMVDYYRNINLDSKRKLILNEKALPNRQRSEDARLLLSYAKHLNHNIIKQNTNEEKSKFKKELNQMKYDEKYEFVQMKQRKSFDKVTKKFQILNILKGISQ